MEENSFQISQAIKQYRISRGLSMDQMAQLSGVSRSMICNIEGAKTSPTVTVLSKLATAMEISLADLVDPRDRPRIYQRRSVESCEKVRSKEKTFWHSLLSAGSPNRHVEIFAFGFDKKGKHIGHREGPRRTEYVYLEKGKLKVIIGDEEVELSEGQALEFQATQPHQYVQDSSELARGLIIIHYG